MEPVHRINTITDLHTLLGAEKPLHPLVSIVDFTKIDTQNAHDGSRFATSFYTVMFKEKVHAKMKYGREYYDFQEGTLLFMAPEQVLAVESEGQAEGRGWGLFFHPDLIRRFPLGSRMKEFTFFQYEVHEALHLSDAEKKTLSDCLEKIQGELANNIDKHSQPLIVSNIELLLNYCLRFYDRQFITRVNSNKDVISRFEDFLSEYFNSDLPQKHGLPSVKFLAGEMNLSPNYLSDLLKKETGKNAQEHIHYHLIEAAKTMLLSSNGTVSQIAYDLGFEYPQYFSKIFKSKTGVSPAKYRTLN